MNTVKYLITALLLAVTLAACSIPIPSQEADLGLQLEDHPISVTRAAAGADISPAQGLDAFTGSISVTANKVDGRLTITELVIPIEVLPTVEVISPPAGLPEASYTLTDFVVSFSVSSATESVQIGQISLPATVEMNLLAGSIDYRLDLSGANIFDLHVISSALDSFNDIVTGNPDEQFSFSARIDFMADLPADTELEFTLRDGTARLEGRGSL